MKKLVLFLVLLFFLLHQDIFAQIRINEVLPRPSPGVDWIEFYNSSGEVVNLENFRFLDASGNEKRFDCRLINPYGFVTVDWGNFLNNNGDTIFLYLDNQLVDCFSYGNGDGSYCPDIFPTRFPTPPFNFSWQRATDGASLWILGLPTKDNPNDGSSKPQEAICFNPTPTPFITTPPTPISSITEEAKMIQTPTPTILPVDTVKNVYLSEIMVFPNSGETEWIEFYNDNDFEVFLNGWLVDDIEKGGSAPKVFDMVLKPKSFAVLELNVSMFNNDGDSVRILTKDGILVESFEYQGGERGKTWGRVSFETDEFCQQQSSKGEKNHGCQNKTLPIPSSITSQPIDNLFPVTSFKTSNEATTSISDINSLIQLGEVLGDFDNGLNLKNNEYKKLKIENEIYGGVEFEQENINLLDQLINKLFYARLYHWLSLNFWFLLCCLSFKVLFVPSKTS